MDIFAQISDIRNHQIHAQHIVVRKGKTAVEYNNIAPILENGKIFTNLQKSAKWRNFYFFRF